MLPSIKTLRIIAGDRARELRKVLEITERSAIEALLDTGKYPRTRTWYYQCYNPMWIKIAKLSIADEIIETCGVEGFSRPGNRGSIDYCNAGDPYTATLMYIEGRGYRVGCWGDVIERDPESRDGA